MKEKIIEQCKELEKKYGNEPFDKALPHLQKGWWAIGEEHGIEGTEVFKIYMDWKSKNNNK